MENKTNWHNFVELVVYSSSEIKPSFFHSADLSLGLSNATLESKSLPYYVGLVLRYEKVSKKGLHKYPAFFTLIFKRKKI